MLSHAAMVSFTKLETSRKLIMSIFLGFSASCIDFPAPKKPTQTGSALISQTRSANMPLSTSTKKLKIILQKPGPGCGKRVKIDKHRGKCILTTPISRLPILTNQACGPPQKGFVAKKANSAAVPQYQTGVEESYRN